MATILAEGAMQRGATVATSIGGLLVTRSAQPVIDVRDVAVGAYLTTVGPKLAEAHGTPTDLLNRAAIVTCDSPEQAAA